MDPKRWIILGALVILIVVFSANSSKSKKLQEASITPTIAQINNSANYVTPNSNLKIEDIIVGEGEPVKVGDTVVIHYTGTLTDGTKFDSSLDRGTPFTTQIGVGQVIQGWDQGVPGMKKGGKRKLTIPSELGYGARGSGDSIPPNSTLIFEVELIEIK